jgi:hypothetical protein
MEILTIFRLLNTTYEVVRIGLIRKEVIMTPRDGMYLSDNDNKSLLDNVVSHFNI